MSGIVECQWSGKEIPKGWQLAPAERGKIESTDYPIGTVAPWNIEWGNIPPGFERCDGRKHGNIQTPDLRTKEDGLVIYVCKVRGGV
jgi:hypothetical protein